ncbi:hypothetical protein, partial [Streptomyces sp. NPDC047706]|uniref:hypothetical protein n=1 Tax=Streptomyces sp. NPDC047706 TaxID=3365486 RepID=UPI003722DCD8
FLEEREAAARTRAEELRLQAERIAAELAEAEAVLARRMIAREEVVEVLALARERAEAAEPEVVPGPQEADAAVATAPVAGSVVPRWHPGATPEALSTDYRRIVELVQDRPDDSEGISAKQLAACLELELVPAKIEGVRSKARRLAERGWLTVSPSGRFTRRPSTGAAPGANGKWSAPGGG